MYCIFLSIIGWKNLFIKLSVTWGEILFGLLSLYFLLIISILLHLAAVVSNKILSKDTFDLIKLSSTVALVLKN